jgi:hypothetical protein
MAALARMIHLGRGFRSPSLWIRMRPRRAAPRGGERVEAEKPVTVSLAPPSIQRFRILASAFVDSRRLSCFASAMTLKKSLAANASEASLVENPHPIPVAALC